MSILWGWGPNDEGRRGRRFVWFMYTYMSISYYCYGFVALLLLLKVWRHRILFSELVLFLCWMLWVFFQLLSPLGVLFERFKVHTSLSFSLIKVVCVCVKVCHIFSHFILIYGCDVNMRVCEYAALVSLMIHHWFGLKPWCIGIFHRIVSIHFGLYFYAWNMLPPKSKRLLIWFDRNHTCASKQPPSSGAQFIHK